MNLRRTKESEDRESYIVRNFVVFVAEVILFHEVKENAMCRQSFILQIALAARSRT